MSQAGVQLSRPWRTVLLPIRMTNFLDTPCEVRDLVYVEALYTDQIQLAVNEEIRSSDYETFANNEWVRVSHQIMSTKYEDIRFPKLDLLPKPSISLTLMQVSKQVNAEVMLAFCSFNKSKVSSYPNMGKPSVFIKHAKPFRSVIVCLTQDHWPEYFPNPYESYQSGGDLIQAWRKQIKLLASISNLQFLQLDVNSMAWWLFCNRQAPKTRPWTNLLDALSSRIFLLAYPWVCGRRRV